MAGDHSMVTIRDVAKHAGVSVATVSRVINGTSGVREQTVRRVQQSIQALGFEPDFLAQSWRTRVTRTIAAVVSDNTSPHHGIMLREAGAVALAHDYSLILCITYFDSEIENRYLRMLRLRRVDGILLNNIGDCREHVRKFTEAGVPVVLLNRPLHDYGPLVDAVIVDSYRGAYDLVDHLIGVGHRRIAMVCDQGLHEYHKSERLRGYREALLAHGLAYDKDLVHCGSFQSGHAIGDCLQATPRPTALFAAGYGTGLAAMTELRARGLRIPEDIAFAMYDDVQWGAFMHPPLTLMRNPADQVGRVAMELLFARLADRNRLPQEVKLQPTLVVRHSCGYTGQVEDSLMDSDAFQATTLAMPLGTKVS
jgi:DNA-binding LacI/PurR family transcriptional regulator